MRSIAHHHWRQAARECPLLVVVKKGAVEVQPDSMAAADPERTLAAMQALADIDRLSATDAFALKIVAAMAEGLETAEIRQRLALDGKICDSASRRMRRALLRRDGGREQP